ncbi:hypothetical protein CC2G_014868 [Coprinopsis cinerea AmutBmut pab1-1]|nr:hypothetical protein CC2G_014868 [Coprinopsis cinerea AmutBmut pab1-1]
MASQTFNPQNPALERRVEFLQKMKRILEFLDCETARFDFHVADIRPHLAYIGDYAEDITGDNQAEVIQAVSESMEAVLNMQVLLEEMTRAVREARVFVVSQLAKER